jgi:hypothetical protein
MSWMHKLAIAVATILMVACATPYKPPTTGPLATVRFWVSERSPLTNLDSFESRSCDGRAYLGTVLSKKAAKTPEQATLVTTVRANQEFIAKFHSEIGGYITYSCRGTVAFTPREGVTYSVWIDFDAGTRRCLAMVQEVDRDSGRLVPTRDNSLTRPSC